MVVGVEGVLLAHEARRVVASARGRIWFMTGVNV